MVLLTTPLVAKLELKPVEFGLLKEFRMSPDSEKFTELKKGKVKTEGEARHVALQWLLDQRGISANETCFVFGLYEASQMSGRNWLWEVRVNEWNNQLSAIILIDAISGEIFGALPTKPKS
jgi:hypothetical protein